MTSELGPEEREAQLAAVWKRIGKAVRRGDTARYGQLQREYDGLKAEHIALSHAEMKAAMRARKAAERAERASEVPGRWRLPAGFGRSPLARERDRQGRVPGAPQVPAGGLRPWRRGSLMSERIWP